MRILELYDAGYGMRTIAKMLGRGQSFISTILIENNVPRRARGGGHAGHFRLPQKEVYDLIQWVHVERVPIDEVCQRLGICHSQVYWRLRQAGAQVGRGRPWSPERRAAWERSKASRPAA